MLLNDITRCAEKSASVCKLSHKCLRATQQHEGVLYSFSEFSPRRIFWCAEENAPPLLAWKCDGFIEETK